MSSFDIRTDAPGLLRAESLNITIKFDRTSATTGRVSWNIPRPAAGCTAETQAYCGMLVTIDTTPASFTKIPTNGTVYDSDVSADVNLFAGSTISTALVVGAFYEDRTTTFFDITGLKPNTPYYVSGFPMDCQHRYFVEGVHAYSLDFKNRGTEGTHGTNVVILNVGGPRPGALLTDYTGLSSTVNYDFSMQLGISPRQNRPINQTESFPVAPNYTITINGTDAQSYTDLVAAINYQFALLSNPTQGPSAPNTGAYYWNSSQSKLFTWDGGQHLEVPIIVDNTAPTSVIPGSYWLHPTTKILSMRVGTVWNVVTVVEFATDPALPIADTTYWYDGTNVRIWNGNTWCNVTSFTQVVDPSLPVSPPAGSYWYNSTVGILYSWDAALDMWDVTTAIQYHENPNALTPGAYWFNETTNKIYAYNGPSLGWTEIPNATVAELPPLSPVAGRLWYNLQSQDLFVRNVTNTTWTQLDVIIFPTDPTVRTTCGLWWDTVSGNLKVWDTVNIAWVAVSSFYQQATDPASPPVMSDGYTWYNTTTSTLRVWENNCFRLVPFISWATDPRTTIVDGTVWHNTTVNVWSMRQTGVWVTIDPITSLNDPTNLPSGTFWFNTATPGLQQWNGISWVAITYSTAPLTPTIDFLWFDTTVSTLKKWTSLGWVPATLLATVELDVKGNLLFTDSTVGSLSFIQLTNGTLFTSFDTPIAIYDSSPGSDGASDEPSYNELGVGTDGSGEQRAQLANDLRYELGYPVVDVELTPEQMDRAITIALMEFRTRSGMAYKRGFFFMHIKANEQTYYITNKISGMNKIVDIMGIYRLTSSFLSSAHGAGVYGQIVLQHMYNMGTFDLLSYHIMSEYTKLMEMLFAARITYQWNEQSRELFINHRFSHSERIVCIEATSERTEQDLMTDRYVRSWIRKYASAQCRLMLAEIRGKFSTLPGAGGSVTLNANELRQQAATDIEACMLDIEDYIVDGPDGYGIGASFTFG